MTTTLQRAERILVDANTRLVDLATEIGAGKWIGKEKEVALLIADICPEIRKATALLFASDGSEQNSPSSLDIH